MYNFRTDMADERKKKKKKKKSEEILGPDYESQFTPKPSEE